MTVQPSTTKHERPRIMPYNDHMEVMHRNKQTKGHQKQTSV